MNDDFRFPDYAWLVKTVGLGQFLDLAFTNDPGEIWLFNNDLELIRDQKSFLDLYLERIAGRHRRNIRAVKIILRRDEVDAKLGLKKSLLAKEWLRDRLREIAMLPNGKNRLASFYFSVAEEDKMPDSLRSIVKNEQAQHGKSSLLEDAWVFYAQRGSLDSGMVLVRHCFFPFRVEADPHRDLASVWMLQHYPVLQQRLKEVFAPCFETKRFVRMEVTSNAPHEPFQFNLVTANQSAKSKRTQVREKKKPAAAQRMGSLASVSLGDRVDVAIITALPEERVALKAVLIRAKPKAIPLYPDYEFAILKSKGGTKRILLTTINDQGTVPAAIRTWDMIERWKPERVMLLGVAGGNPRNRDISLGDILVGNWVVGYERGKVENGKFKSEISKWTADPDLLRVATELKNSVKWQTKITLPKPSRKRTNCKVHDDLAIGSGSKLVSSARFFAAVKRKYRKIEGIEMEADGVGCACDKAQIKVLVVKSVMDKCDELTRNQIPAKLRMAWMRYAAHTAAVFGIEVIRSL